MAALRLKSEQYFNCPEQFRRQVGAKRQLLVEEVGSGQRIWIDVTLNGTETCQRKRQLVQ